MAWVKVDPGDLAYGTRETPPNLNGLGIHGYACEYSQIAKRGRGRPFQEPWRPHHFCNLCGRRRFQDSWISCAVLYILFVLGLV